MSHKPTQGEAVKRKYGTSAITTKREAQTRNLVKKHGKSRDTLVPSSGGS